MWAWSGVYLCCVGIVWCASTGIDIGMRDGKGRTVLEALDEIPGEKLKDIQKLIAGLYASLLSLLLPSPTVHYM